jgi:hypothetical protein
MDAELPCRNPNCGMADAECDEQLERTGRCCCSACHQSGGGTHVHDDDTEEDES